MHLYSCFVLPFDLQQVLIKICLCEHIFDCKRMELSQNWRIIIGVWKVMLSIEELRVSQKLTGVGQLKAHAHAYANPHASQRFTSYA